MVSHFFNHKNGGLHLAIAVQGLAIVIMGVWIATQIISNRKASSFKPNFPKIAVEVSPVKIGDFEQFTTAVGTLRSNHNIIVKSEIEGKVKEIHVKSGQKVKKGDKLISLDSEIYKAQVKDSKAKLIQMQAIYKRAQALFAKRAISTQDKEKAHADLLRAEAELDIRQSQLKKPLWHPLTVFLVLLI